MNGLAKLLGEKRYLYLATWWCKKFGHKVSHTMVAGKNLYGHCSRCGANFRLGTANPDVWR